jgi:hypothetical protein
MKEKNKKSRWIFYLILVLIIASTAYVFLSANSAPGQYDGFAKCLVDSGAKMYGAWWCSHCNNQKEAFGKSWKIFAEDGGYVECSTADRQRIEICVVQNITGYPTWRFGDGSELGGEQSFAVLADKSGCKI